MTRCACSKTEPHARSISDGSFQDGEHEVVVIISTDMGALNATQRSSRRYGPGWRLCGIDVKTIPCSVE